MINSQKYLLQAGRTIVLSIKPKYAELILSGKKTVELRRMWAAEHVAMIVIYASSPIQRLVGTVKVERLAKVAPPTLWKYCKERGGGLDRDELLNYFTGKKSGYAVLLKDVVRFHKMIDPTEVIDDFSAPQSFRYMSIDEIEKLERKLRNRK